MWEHRIKIGKRRHEARSERHSGMEKQPGILSAPALNSCYCPGLPLLSEFPVPKSPKLEAWWPHQPRFQSGAESFCPVLPPDLIAWILFLCGFRLGWWNTEMGLWVRGSSSQILLFLDGKTGEPGWIKGMCWRVAVLDQCRVGLSANPPLGYWRSHESVRRYLTLPRLSAGGSHLCLMHAWIPVSKKVTEG